MNAAPIRRAVQAGACALAVAALSACGAIGDLVPGQDPFLDQSPRSIAKASFADMRDVTSMRILGSQEDKKHGFMRIDLKLDQDACTGSLDTAAGTIRIVKNTDGAWFSADEDFWRTHAGSSPAAEKVVRDYAGRWSSVSGKNALLALCDLDGLLESFALDEDDTDDTIEAGEVVPVGDADTVPVTGQDGKERVTAWVSVEAPHHVLKMAPAKDKGRPDELFFEEFGLDVVAESPAKKDVVVLPQGAKV